MPSANQYTFIVTTRPTNMAGQLKSVTMWEAANNIATVRPTLAISHTKNPITAEPGFAELTRLVRPLAKTAEGKQTAMAP
jgi:hypothetical protein